MSDAIVAKSQPISGDPEKKGWLFKWTNYLKGYQRRWFVLSNGLLSYYRNQAEVSHTCRGTISLLGALIHTADSCTFVISNGGTQTFHIRAHDEVERQSWVTALELAKAKAIRAQESDDDEDQIGTGAAVASADGDSEDAGGIARELGARFHDLRTCSELVARHGAALQRSLVDLEIPPTDTTKQVSERATLFRISCNAMMNACSEFMSAAAASSARMSRALQHEREQKMRLQEVVEQLARQHDNLEKTVTARNTTQAAKVVKTGRKPFIEKSKQKEVFKKYADKLLDVKFRNPIFDTVASDLDNLMTPAALYMSRKRNFRDFLKTECKQQSVFPSSSSLSSSSSPRTCSETSPFHVESNQCHSENDTKNFKFELDICDWKKLLPLNVLYKRNDLRTCAPFKKYKILPKYKWLDILREKIWLITKLPCTWNFRCYKVESEHRILIKGQCSQCNALTKIACKKVTDKIIEGQCQITVGEKNKKHYPRKKYRLKTLVRRKLAKKLKHKSASLVHKQLAAKMSKQESTDTAPVIPTLNALRKVKYKERKKMWLHHNVILSILTMAVTKPIFLRDIHIFPRIHIYYWTDEQQQYCREYQYYFQRLTITLDATGSMFQPLKLPNGYELSKRLYLYVIILINQLDVRVPLCQMITDSHDTASISAWLLQWLKNVRCHPDEVITEDSSALVAANVKTFTDFTCVKDYLLRCFSVLNGNKEEPPKTFIRLDTSNFINTLYNFTCFKNVDTKIKMYYIYCIRYIKECQDFALVKDIITKIIKLCLYQNDFENEDSSLKESKQNLDKLLNSHEFVDFKNVDQNKEFECDQIVFDDADVREIVAWFDLLVENETKSNAANSYVGKNSPYYLPLFIPTLKTLFIKLPLWSNVMCPYFKSETLSPSSSAVESYFRTLKQLVFKTKIARQRIDEYLQHHYDYIKGELYLALNQLKNFGSTVNNKHTLLKFKQHRTRRTMTKNIYNKGKVNPKIQIQQKQKDLYFSSDSIFSDRPSYLDLKKDDEIVFIRNGNVALKESSGYFNTCAFDSAFYLIAQACIRSLAFKIFLSALKGDCVINYIFMLLNGAHDIEQIYNCRSKIAKTFFHNKDCSCNVAYIFEKIFINYFTSAQYLKTCTNCNYTQLQRAYVFILINLDVLTLFGITSLEEAICFDEKINTMCQKCDTQLKGELKLGEIITFDLNGAADSVLLTELPITINIKDNYYFLVGAIEFIPGTKIGHYKCHFFNKNTYFCYDDNFVKIEISTCKKICLHSVSYIHGS